MDAELSSEQWLLTFTSILSTIKPQLMVFAGKEILARKRDVELLGAAVQLRDKLQKDMSADDRTQIGLITNGLLASRYRNELVSLRPDYIDISIDGLPDLHVAVRGKNFEYFDRELKWLAKQFSDKLWITHTLMRSNIDSLAKFIQYYHLVYKIQNFSIGFYKPQSFTDPSLVLDKNSLNSFSEKFISDLEGINTNGTLNVQLETDNTQSGIPELFYHSGWAIPWLRRSSVNFILGNNVNLRFNAVVVTGSLLKENVRITHEGHWLAAENLTKVKSYSDFAFGNLKEVEFDANELYRKSQLVSETTVVME